MFDNASTAKIAIRNLPGEVLQALTELANQRDRSVEAEARHALRNWVQPQLQGQARVARAGVIGQRLRYLLDELNALHPGRSASPSRIAERIGWSHANAIEQWFAGEDEASFADLNMIATVVGCSGGWLAHGEGHPFPSEYARIPERPESGVEWLLAPVAAGDPPIAELHLVRSDSKEGQFAFVKRYSDWKASTFHTPYHVSEEIGAGGESSLAWLTLTMERLYKQWTTFNLTVKSYVVQSTTFSELLEGKRHPINILQSHRTVATCWWEDIWDETQFRKQHEYWPGWRRLAERIARVVEGNTAMKEQRDAIRGRGPHDPDAPTPMQSEGQPQ
jgi:antitoxin FitA